MSAVLKPFSEGAEGGPLGYSFFCPGCQEAHCVWVRRRADGTPGPVWDWNGSVERPTFSPSVLVRSMAGWTQEVEAEWDALLKQGTEVALSSRFGTRCHSFVADGVIDFLSDCTHALRGKHPLPPHPRLTQPETST